MFVRATVQIWGVLAVKALVPRAAFGATCTLVHTRRDGERRELRDIGDGTEIIHRVLRKVSDQMPFATTSRGLDEDGVRLFYEGTLVGAIVHRGDIPTIFCASVRPKRSVRVRIIVHVDEVSIFLVVEKKFISNAGRAPTYAICPTFDA